MVCTCTDLGPPDVDVIIVVHSAKLFKTSACNIHASIVIRIHGVLETFVKLPHPPLDLVQHASL